MIAGNVRAPVPIVKWLGLSQRSLYRIRGGGLFDPSTQLLKVIVALNDCILLVA